MRNAAKLILPLLLLPAVQPALAADNPQVTAQAANESSANGGPAHITAIIPGDANDLWIASEGEAVWNLKAGQWTQYKKGDPGKGPGDDLCYALALDTKGRLWAGTLNHGVSVFNGKTWQTYNTWEPSVGPAGSHVFALAVSPKTGDVWIATDLGVTRYSDAQQTWTTFGRAEGLPTDQVRGIAITPAGDVFLATACDGVVIGRQADDFKTWEHVTGPDDVEGVPVGKGLPLRETNCAICDADGHVYVGTPCGLAVTSDGGKNWRFVRGKDWVEKVQRRYAGAPDDWKPTEEGLMSEDWVSCLWLDPQGDLWIGHREHGYERLDPRSMKVLALQTESPMLNTGKAAVNYVRGIGLGPDGRVLVGRYLVPASWCDLPEAKVTMAGAGPAMASAELPRAAAAPTIEELKRWTDKLAALKANPSVAGAYLGEDWNTSGDWVGHLGRQFAQVGTDPMYNAAAYNATVVIGGHYPQLNAINSYDNQVEGGTRRGLWSPHSTRRQATELNDDGFDDSVASTAVEGPDLWVKVNIPRVDRGAHRISVYLMSPDGQTSRNSLRDYVLELRRDDRAGEAGGNDTANADDMQPGDKLALEKLPIVARGRASDLYAGVYEQFVVNEPGLYWLKVDRNYSFVTKLFGVFVDRVGPGWEKADEADEGPMSYQPAVVDIAAGGNTDREKAARKLWLTAEAAWGKAGAEGLIKRAEMAAYRAAEDEKADPTMLALWRWRLGIWGGWDRQQFDSAMQPPDAGG